LLQKKQVDGVNQLSSSAFSSFQTKVHSCTSQE